MKMLMLVLSLTASFAYAQQTMVENTTPGGCGPAQEKFDVLATKAAAATTSASDNALIYVIQDDTHFESHPRPTTRIGVDGKWVGATRSNSYLRSLVGPGVHHLCASWQGFVGVGMGVKMAALHFSAEPGKSYYFRVRTSGFATTALARSSLKPSTAMKASC
jgi:hypothetical protein